MALLAVACSLQVELQSILDALKTEPKISCHGASRGGKRCGNWLSKATKSELCSLMSDLLEILGKDGEGSEEALLEKISFLVMCKRYHQDQASGKCKAWTKRLPSRDSKLSQEVDVAEHTVDRASSKPSWTSASPPQIDSDMQNSAASVITNHQILNWPTILGSIPASTDPELEDPGYQSDSERIPTEKTKIPPDAFGADKPSTFSTFDEHTAPRTPQKPPPLISNDSGVSLTYDEIVEASVKNEKCPESPLADKAKRRKQPAREADISLPTPPSIQAKSSLATTSPGHYPATLTPRKFAHSSKWSHWENSKRLKKYIKEPLTERAINEGYIYCFMLDGCPYTKVGYAGHRKGESSLEESATERIKEHKNCGWREPTVLMKARVPHAFRVEGIIHRHLTAVRKDEVQMCKNSKGRICKHKKHREWFDVTFQEMHVVVNAWKCWIESNPYVELDGKVSLSPKWRKNLETLDLESRDDPWLPWLSHHILGSVKLIKQVLQHTPVGSEIMGRASKGASRVANAAIEVTKHEGDDQKNDETEVATPNWEYRLQPRGTWS